jgi:phage tail-like protein
MFDKLMFSFSKISGLKNAVEFKAIAEGGSNQLAILPDQSTQSNSVTFERPSTTTDKIFNITVTPGTPFNIISIFITQGSIPRKLITLNPCLVTSVSYSELDATQSGIVIETIDIAYGHLSSITM